jgi:anti-anti-sigma factor
MTVPLEVSKRLVGEQVHVQIKGRLDSSWADQLAAALDEIVRSDIHDVSLDMAEVSYMSSAGISVLIRCYKQLQGIRGSLVIVRYSEMVESILATVGLKKLLLREGDADATAPAPVAEAPVGVKQEIGAVSFEVFRDGKAPRLTCRLFGSAEPLATGQFRAEHCRTVRFPPESFGLGMGALGKDYADCHDRFGEFLAARGVAAYLPTDGSNRPDYLLAREALAPMLQVGYGIVCEGPLSVLARFQTRPDAPTVLSHLVESCVQLSGHDSIGMIMAAETTGLVGAALRRSPCAATSVQPLAFPEVRSWLSFTAEPAYSNSSALVVGVAGRGDAGRLTPLVRPLIGGGCWGHFHAAAFSYRPLPKGSIDCRATVTGLFEHQTLEGILHLLGDDRTIVGAGQSEFIRGACWFGPLDTTEVRIEP